MRMIREKVVIGTGVLLIILPFTGFPRFWKTIFTILIGVVLVYVGALLRKFSIANSNSKIKDSNFDNSNSEIF